MAVKKVSNQKDLAEAIEKVEDENMEQLSTEGPVLDEDGVVHGESFFYGYDDGEGTLHTTFSYRELNGSDEEAIGKSDVRGNIAKVYNTLAERCIVQIGDIKKKDVGGAKWKEIIGALLIPDLDYSILKIRELSMGKEITFRHKCPECSTKLNTVISTDDFEKVPFNGVVDIPVTFPGRGYKDGKGKLYKTGVLRRPNALDREKTMPFALKNRAQYTTMLLSRLLSFGEDVFVTPDGVKGMSTRDRNYLEKLMNENNFGVDMSIGDITCSACGADLSDVTAQSDFLSL